MLLARTPNALRCTAKYRTTMLVYGSLEITLQVLHEGSEKLWIHCTHWNCAEGYFERPTSFWWYTGQSLMVQKWRPVFTVHVIFKKNVLSSCEIEMKSSSWALKMFWFPNYSGQFKVYNITPQPLFWGLFWSCFRIYKIVLNQLSRWSKLFNEIFERLRFLCSRMVSLLGPPNWLLFDLGLSYIWRVH